MWAELLEIFRGGSNESMKSMGDDFMRMLAITQTMAEIVRPHVFDRALSLEDRKRILDYDVEVNSLERTIRKQIVNHLSLKHSEVPFNLALLMLVSHAERVGDYIKNISDVEQLGGGEVPEGPLRNELADLIDLCHKLFDVVPSALRQQDKDQATEYLRVGKNMRKRSDKLLVELSKSDLNAAQTTAMVLLARFYRRIAGHLCNILSSVVLPVHEIDHFSDPDAEG